jgi:hypothetical protein
MLRARPARRRVAVTPQANPAALVELQGGRFCCCRGVSAGGLPPPCRRSQPEVAPTAREAGAVPNHATVGPFVRYLVLMERGKS